MRVLGSLKLFKVVFDDGSDLSTIEIRDGVDLAFINFTEPRKSTIPQTFTFPPAAVDRTANLDMFFSSVSGTLSGFGFRPNSIEVTTDGVTNRRRCCRDTSNK